MLLMHSEYRSRPMDFCGDQLGSLRLHALGVTPVAAMKTRQKCERSWKPHSNAIWVIDLPAHAG
jgi:hypothetical protein